MDKLGNRISVNDKNNNDITYAMVNNTTNRYSSVGTASLAYDDAGNLTTDEQDYDYEYDYENRIVEISDTSGTIAQYDYDALGRRIRKIAGSDTRLYYYNNNNQVIIATDSSGTVKENNVFGNYIDEVVYSLAGYHIHDHLYSVVAITNSSGLVQERIEYDAYGLPTFYNAGFTTSYSTSQLPAETPYLFTGRRVDILDSGSLKLQYNRNRYYSYALGRWMTHDPLGITPNPQSPNYFKPMAQYTDGLNVYEYVKSQTISKMDEFGLKTKQCNCGPDVTIPLRRFKTQVTKDFNQLSVWQQTLKCSGMWGTDRWDIDQLHGGPGLYPGCANGDCKETVQVNGKCYSQHAVNYYLWGVMNSLCSVLPQYHIEEGLIWAFISGDYSCKREWALAGLKGTTYVSGCPEYLSCKKTCKKKITSNFTYRWISGIPIF